MMRRALFVAALLMIAALPARAQLVGTDTVPGSSCAGFPQGATRLTADADLNGAEVTLVCNGTNWLPVSGGSGSIDALSDGISNGTDTVFLGVNAGGSGAGGFSAAVGIDALRYASSGALNNTAIGHEALRSSTTPANNTGDYNAALGFRAMFSNTEGDFNAAMGTWALRDNISGDYNTALGSLALGSNTTGNNNTALGYQALHFNNARSRSTAIGYEAMYYADGTGTAANANNVALGYQALYGSTTPANNTGVNNTALGTNAMLNNTAGSNNIAIGFQAGDLNTTGTGNIIIGYDIDAPLAATSNYLNLGGKIFGDITAAGTITVGGTAALKVPVGTDAERPASPVGGMIRFSSTSNNFEGYNGTSWGGIGGSGGAAAPDRGIQFNSGSTFAALSSFTYSSSGNLTVGNVLLRSTGALATPFFAFNNDSDTGVFTDTADTVEFSAGGIQALELGTTASGVNYFRMVPGATGTAPTLTNVGANTNGAGLGLNITAKSATAAGAGGPITITGGAASGANAGGAVSITAGAAAATAGSSGGTINITATAGTASSTGGVGGAVAITAGNAQGSSNNAGGNVTLTAGAATGTGAPGMINIASGVRFSGDISPAALAANTNDYNPAGLGGAAVVRLSASAAVNLTGLAGGQDGRRITLMNVGSDTITITSNDAASAASNRFLMTANVPLQANQAVSFVYDSTANAWRADGIAGIPVGGAGTPSGCDATATYSTAGIHNYVVPSGFGTITVRLWGGGGGGGSEDGTSGGSGGASSVTSLGLSAGGGSGGINGMASGAGGVGGTAAGGAVNTNGQNGAAGGVNGGNGGTAPSGGGLGGVGGVGTNGSAGGAPGGGGGGGNETSLSGGGGGSGAYVEKTYTSATLIPGTNISDIVVGIGGAIGNGQRDGGAGGVGRVSVVCASAGAGAVGANGEVVFFSGGNYGSDTRLVFNSASGILSVSSTGALRLPAGIDGERPVAAASGMIRFSSTSNSFEGYNGTSWGGIGGSGTPAGSGREVQFNSGGAFSAVGTFVFTSSGSLIVGSPLMNSDANPAHNNRMFFNKSKGAFRAGFTNSSAWDDASQGTSSVAMGSDTTASGTYSVAMGQNSVASGARAFAMGDGPDALGASSVALGLGTTASGTASVAMGNFTSAGNYSMAAGSDTIASGSYSVAMGQNSIASGARAFAMGDGPDALGASSVAMGLGTMASGTTSVALGRFITAGNGTAGSGLGDGTMALGLIDDAVTITTPSQVTGIQSLGVFMGDQDGLVVSTSNQMSLLGGKMVIDPAVPATNLVADTALEVAGTLKIGDGGEPCGAGVAGAMRYNGGAIQFCNGTSWGGMGGGSAASPDRGIQFNSGNSFTAASSFSYSSTGDLALGNVMLRSTGALAAPDFSFNSDSNTGMFSDTADTVEFTAGGVQALELGTTASAVNYLRITPGTAAVVPTIANVGTTTNGVGLGINITARNASTSGVGGGIALTAGSGVSAGAGGAVTVSGGSGPAAANGGAVTITSGSSGSGTSGAFNISTGGSGFNTGNLNISTGFATAMAGSVNITAGNGTTAGHVNITAGGSATTTGNVTITGGFSGGDVIIAGGSSGGLVDVASGMSFSNDFTPASLGADVNNYNPGIQSVVYRLTASGAFNITGLAGGADGRLLVLINVGASNITLVDESALSTAANRFALVADEVLVPDEAVQLLYDATSQRWRLVR
jgi:hypothetical protein